MSSERRRMLGDPGLNMPMKIINKVHPMRWIAWDSEMNLSGNLLRR